MNVSLRLLLVCITISIIVTATTASAVDPQIADPRYLVTQDIPETNIPDFAPPLAAMFGGGTTYTLHEEDFELGPNGWTTCDRSASTTGPCLSGPPPPPPTRYGDFAALFPGITLLQEDPLRMNVTSGVWGFFSGSTFDYSCGGWPSQLAVPFQSAAGFYIYNEINSPIIDWLKDAGGNTVPLSATAAYLNFDVYADLPLDNLVFYYWRVRWFDIGLSPIVAPGSDSDGWFRNSLVYYDGTKSAGLKQWIRPAFEFGKWAPLGASYVQVAIGIQDVCDPWCGVFGSGACHSHSPLIDDVAVVRIDPPAVWSVNNAHLFQDNFASDGTLTGTVRVDMARDIAPLGSNTILPGDSAVVGVTEPVNGIGTDMTHGGPAVYIHVKDLPGGKSGVAISDDPSRWPVVSTSAGWTTLRMDQVYEDAALTISVPHSYCVDLADDLYVPGDTVTYYFSAVDGVGNPSYWNEFTGVSTIEQDARDHAMEMTCLPANGLTTADILYVDAVDGGGVQPYYDWGILSLYSPDWVDRFDMRGPSQVVNNGLSSRVSDVINQLTAAYRVIIWDAGDLAIGPVQDGSAPFKPDDFPLLLDFLDNLPAPGGLYIAGDNVASAWNASPSAAAATLRSTYIDFSLIGHSYRQLTTSETETLVPEVIGQPLGCFDHVLGPDSMIALGNGTYANDFDVVSANPPAILEMAYNNDPTRGAVVGQHTINNVGQEVGVLLQGFSFRFLREDRSSDQKRVEREHHLEDVLLCLNLIPGAVVDGGPPGLRTGIHQNYPNPFNPRTTIRYSVAARVHVTLSIYDVSGRHVRTLVDGWRSPASYEVDWDGRNGAGERVASGVYFYRFEAGAVTETKKMVMLK